jgi:predicted N-acetyltransferase YhbS
VKDRKVTIFEASWTDILTVLRQTHAIWSAGLSRSDYREYIHQQLKHPWGTRNHKFFVLKEGEKLVSSCKLYTVRLSSRGRSYKLGGLGAIYTFEEARNKGYGSALIEQIIDRCHEHDYDGMILFSDIDPAYYERFGFMSLGAADFTFQLPWHQPVPLAHLKEPNIIYFEKHHIPAVASIYRKWQRRQPFAFERSETYFDYRFLKERYLAEHSRLAWPKLQIRFSPCHTAYALTETGGSVLRILEIVGSQTGVLDLWSLLFEEVYERQIQRVRGWESAAAAMSPGFRLENVLSAGAAALQTPLPTLDYYQRDWGLPMMLPFVDEMDDWFSFFPCPLLELDHL